MSDTPLELFEEAKEQFALIYDRLCVLRSDLRYMAKGGSGVHLSKKGIETCMGHIIDEVAWGKPFMPCPNSHSSVKHPASCRCLGSGFIPMSEKKS